MKHVFLIGFMGAGKSTVGRDIGNRLMMPFLDLDEQVEMRAGRSVPRIFAEDGEVEFRRLEHEALARLEHYPPAVVACGGGVVIDPDNRVLLKSLGTVIYLHVSAEEAIARVGSTEGRPLLAGPDPLRAANTLLTARQALYEAAADITIETAGLTPDEVAAAVVDAL